MGLYDARLRGRLGPGAARGGAMMRQMMRIDTEYLSGLGSLIALVALMSAPSARAGDLAALIMEADGTISLRSSSTIKSVERPRSNSTTAPSSSSHIWRNARWSPSKAVAVLRLRPVLTPGRARRRIKPRPAPASPGSSIKARIWRRRHRSENDQTAATRTPSRFRPRGLPGVEHLRSANPPSRRRR